jgi:regulator of RNase E activity RraA
VPVTFGELTFRPGALLHSDEDGIVVLDAAD